MKGPWRGNTLRITETYHRSLPLKKDQEIGSLGGLFVGSLISLLKQSMYM